MELDSQIFDGSSEGILNLCSIIQGIEMMFDQTNNTPDAPPLTPELGVGMAIKAGIGAPSARMR